MNPNVTTAFDPLLVALSFAFAVIGSFVALTAAGRVNQRGGRQSLSNVLTVGIALGGIGVWSMHFIGMLALDMDVGSSYSMVDTFASLLVVIVATSWTVSFAARSPDNLPRLVTAGVLLSWEQSPAMGLPWGALAIVGACLCWAIDNNLTRKVSASDAADCLR